MRHREEPMQNRLATLLLVVVVAFSALLALSRLAPASTLMFAAVGLCALLVFFWFAGRDS